MFRKPAFRPQSRAIALEPRILFDGAAAVAVDQQNSADSALHVPVPAAEAAPRTLVVIDTRIDNYQALASQAAPGADVVLVGAGQDGLKAISDALAAGSQVASIQILSHGAPGQFALGNQSISADNVAALSDTLRAWAPQLTADADILLYGCGVGAGEAGRTLITALAAATGADVAASTNDTGATGAGGDWTLEVSTGAIETGLVAMSYEGLLADAAPTVALSTTAMDSLLGGQFSFTASFTNSSSQAGFAPYIDLILPATGKDGAGAEIDDGITFVSATYLGQTVKAYTITFDAAGNATHPLAKDITGAAVIVNAAAYGARAGDQLVVLELPYASVSDGQPAIPVVVTCKLSDLADTQGSPDLTIKARGGFQFGNDAADDPTIDPSLIEAGTHSLVIHPTVVTLTSSVNMPEGETATGPNFEHTITVTATPAPGQTLTNVDVTQALPDTIRITGITPGAGGTVTSLTLANGTVITNPVGIGLVLGAKTFLSSYTVHYDTLSAPATSTVSFFVAEDDYTGASVLDPLTGDDRSITVTKPTASGEWLPLDPRDRTPVLDPDTGAVIGYTPDTISGTGSDSTFVAKSVILHKSIAIASDTGSAGLSPGDTLQYTLEVDLSDYFAIGKTLLGAGSLTISDSLGDGQRLVAGTPTMTVYVGGVPYVIALVTTTGTPDANGTALTFDIAQSLLNDNRILGGALVGDLRFDGDVEGATRAIITYRSTAAQAYTKVYPQSEINEGDAIGNNATVSGSLLDDPVALTGYTEADTSAASLAVPTHNIQTSIVTVNGSAPAANVELRPGDIVTFRMSYDLQTGDYENFSLTSYLPLPLFDLAGLSLTQGTGIGQWTYGTGNTNPDLVDTVAVNTGNSLLFNFGSYVNSGTAGSKIVVDFTLQVGNQPFADQRALTVLAQSDQLTTIPTQQHLVSSGVVNITSVAEPVLAIKHGVVSVGAGSGGLVTGTTGTWAAAGTGGTPFTGSVTDLAAIDGNVTNIDAADLVRLATAIENTGGLGAYDVTTTVTLPTGLSFAGGSLASANVKVYRGDGTALVLGTDYSISGTTITFLDNGGPSLLPGRSGTANDTSGANLVVITYDVVAANTVAASQNFETGAALTNYSSVNGGPDFTPVDLTDKAAQAIAAPALIKGFAGGTLDDSDSSSPSTSGADLVVGESMLYDIVVTLPEGVTQNLRLDDLIPAGLQLDTGFNSNSGYQLITTVAGSAALTADFAGSVTVSGIAATPSGTLGADGVDARLTFSAAGATGDNVTTNNSFVIRVRLIAGNVIGNQAGANRANSAQVIYTDPDGDPPPATPAAIDRTVALSGSQPSITMREPTVQLTQTAVTSNGNPGQVDAGDTVTYTITISNGTSSSDFAAYDISFSNALPSELDSIVLQSVVYAGGATKNGGSDFTLSGRNLTTTAGANIDIPTGGSITLTVTGIANSTVASVFGFTNTPEVRWTSLDGSTSIPQANERTGADGLLNSGSLNDYRQISPLAIEVVSGSSISHVGGLPDTPAASPTDADQSVAVGEIIRYRVAFVLAEGTTNGATIKIALPDGLSFINDPNTTTIGLIANNAITNASDLTTGANPDVTGISITNRSQALLAADLSNTMTAVLSSFRIDTANPREIVINLGDLNNLDRDSDREAIYLDFNVRVDNTTAVDTSKSLVTSATLYANGTTFLDKTDQIAENVVEPTVTNLIKTVTAFDPRPTLATGIATVSIDFTNSGDGIGYDFHLTDAFPAGKGSNYTVTAVIIDGISYAPGSLPSGVTASGGTSITADFERLAQGSKVRVVYTVEVPNKETIAATNATLTWSSLPESFSSFQGSAVGIDGDIDGERTDPNTNSAPANTYIDSENAGLGLIQGKLWDDTASTTSSTTPDGPGLSGQTVTLTWAGADGDLATTADNLSFTTTTDANGAYIFGVLPSGKFRIDTPTTVLAYPFPGDTDNAKVRIDSDGPPLATITISALGEASTATADAGYVRDNDAPVNTLPAAPTTLEDTSLAITGISVADLDAGIADLTVKLSVLHGTLNFSSSLPSGVTIDSGALNSASVTIKGSQAALNTALATLVYSPTLNYNGTDTLTVLTNDLGHLGDANGDLLVNAADALTDTDRLTINITPVNDAPVANPDYGRGLEAGGKNNDVPGYPAEGNVLKNDTDVDLADNPSTEALSVTLIRLGSSGSDVAVTSTGTAVIGTYGTLTIYSNGFSRYVIDNNNAAVEALRTSGQTLTETFTYTMADSGSLTASALITVTIQGNNDTPVGIDDEGSAYEAGGVANGTPGGVDSFPNVLANDTDVDSVANGETRSVTGIRYKKESSTSGTMTGVPPGGSATVAGSYGSLTMNSDGTYAYAVNQDATAVQRLVAGDVLYEYFSYLVTDTDGLTDTAQIRITINGANDNPVASDDQAAAQAASTNGNAAEGNPTGNVILFPSRPGNVNDPGGNGVDTDVDRTDQPNSNLVVDGIRTGVEGVAVPVNVAGGTTSVTGTSIAGSYGTLTIGADGSFYYDVDSTNPTVIALTPGATLTDSFTYQIKDTAGLKDQAQINIIVRGANDPPVAQNVVALATEAGGIANGTVGVDPSGDAMANDFDPDGDPITVTAVRTGTEGGSGTAGTVGAPLVGLYGTLTLNADGTYTYVVNNTNAAVEALRQSGDTLTDTFTYTISDNQLPTPETDQAEISVVISGQNDNPVAVLDTATAVEAGGIANGIAGTNPAGNVLSNDTDVDLFGETKTVTAVSGSAAGTVDSTTAGSYGTLTLNANGSYTYLLDNNNAAVQALRTSANTLTEVFTYTVSDALGATSSTTLTITIQGANDTPVAAVDTATAVEAGGIANATPGTNPTGNVLANDSDVDSVTNGETKAVTAFVNSASVAGTVGSALAGSWGSLTLNADGSYSYVVDNANPTVQALRTTANTLSDTFTYTIRDTAGATATATLTVTILGANDTPVANDDGAIAIEAGGVFNGTPGIDPTGNVLSNDTDVDSVAFGETMRVQNFRTGIESGIGGSPVAAGMSLAGQYGTLTLNADGSYTYVVDNNNATVQALRLASQTLSDSFTYTVIDAWQETDKATLTITIRGANDNPVAVDNIGLAAAPVPSLGLPGRNPFGNVLPNDIDVDAGDTKTVTGIRSGTEAGGGVLTSVAAGTNSTNGQVIVGTYGELTIGADGSHIYIVDPTKTAALRPTDIVRDYFTYQVTDAGGLTDLAQYTVILRGANYPPVASDDSANAVEAGGIANGTAGIDPDGDALLNDTDAEGDALTVTAVRTGPETGGGTSGALGSELRGTYGWLTMQADGKFSYRVDNNDPQVEALRNSGNTLTDTFTYTAEDSYGATDQATITVTIQGANDNPVANNDAATAVESGGLANATAGVNPTGNVLSNDSDVDAYGETSAVVTVSGIAAGTVNGTTTGNFGSLTLNADGSYTYTVDNTNPVVEALRLASHTLTDSFTYTMTDATGARSTARLTITIQGANDNPVASDDAGAATDAAGPPVTTGNVLPNDSDVDSGDSKTVIAVRTGGETSTGSAGSIGTRLQGKYGSLVLNADGSWRYEVDTANQDVLNAAGAGKVLSDVFTYTMRDTEGATDQAQLVITLDMMAPYTDTGTSPFFNRETESGGRSIPLPNVEPITFIHQVVSAVDRQLRLSNTRNDGSDITQEEMPEIRSLTLGAGLGLVPDQFVGNAVKGVRAISQLDRNEVEARQGVVSLSADGLLADPSVFVPDPRLMIEAAPTPHDRLVLRTSSAPSFREQLELAAQRFRPVTVNSHPERIPGEIHHIS